MSKQDNKKYYAGNPNLKAAGVLHEYTLNEIQLFQKCLDDPLYFINNYVKVVSLDKGIIPFNTYPYQNRIINTVDKNRFTICKLFRQSGYLNSLLIKFL